MRVPFVILGLTCLTGTLLATAFASAISTSAGDPSTASAPHAPAGDSPLAPLAPADDPPPPAPDGLALVDRYGGHVGGVTAAGDRALASFGFRVHEYDLSDPSAPRVTRRGPTVAGRPTLLPGNLAKMVQRDGWTYGIVDWDRQVAPNASTRLMLVVLDADLSVAGTLELPGNTFAGAGGEFHMRALELALLGEHHLVVAESEADGDHLRLIDVARPAAPALVGDHRIDGFVEGMAVSGDYAHLVLRDLESRDPLLVDVDLTTPSAPKGSAPVALGDGAERVAVGDGHAFVAGCEGLDVFSLADPGEPLLVSSVDLGTAKPPPDPRPGPTPTPDPFAGGSCSWAAQPTWRDGFLYFVTTENLGFFSFEGRTVVRVFDVRRPEAPVLAGRTRFVGATDQLAVGNGFGVVAEMSEGMGVVSLARPDQPQSRGPLVGGRRIIDALAAAPDLVVQSTGFGFDSALEFIVPGRGIVGTFNLGAENHAHAIVIQGGWVYAIVGDFHKRGGEVWVVDARDPAAPRAAGTIPGLGDKTAMSALAIDGDRLWIAEGGLDAEERPVTGAIRAFDISARSRPIEIGRVDGSSFVSVAAGGGFAYAGSLSVDTPSSVQVFTLAQLPGGMAVVAVGSFALESSAMTVALTGNRLYARTVLNGLHIVDVSDPSRPQPLGTLRTVGRGQWYNQEPFSLAIRGDRVYTGSFTGLETIDVRDPTAPRSLGFRKVPSSSACGGISHLDTGVRKAVPEGLIPSLDSLACTTFASGGHVAVQGWDLYFAADFTGLWAFRADTPLARVWLPWVGGGP